PGPERGGLGTSDRHRLLGREPRPPWRQVRIDVAPGCSAGRQLGRLGRWRGILEGAPRSRTAAPSSRREGGCPESSKGCLPWRTDSIRPGALTLTTIVSCTPIARSGSHELELTLNRAACTKLTGSVAAVR